jgi:cellulose synthase/poly-beta-1,6-N-acetylglucosamine synthase-like glycosyltransferase
MQTLSITAVVFWVSLAALVYVYAGYPALLAIVTRSRKPTGIARDDLYAPPVTLIVSAFNEEAVIARKLQNSLALDYPRECLEILVVSDASSDRTDEFVIASPDSRVRLLRMPQRGGKTLGLNEAARHARGEVLVFSDANAHYAPEAIRRLVRNFADPSVGAVTGESRYWIGQDDFSTSSENTYWRYELAIKKLESSLGSLVGGDGAIYAIRKSLYVPMDASDLSDFVNPLQIVRQGFRNVYEPDAVSYEEGAEGFAAEFRRKVRIVNRACRATWKMRDLLNPVHHGAFALQFLSHKVLRWLAPVFMGFVFATNALLAIGSWFFAVLFGLQLLFYALAFAGWLRSSATRQSAVLYIPFYFCAVNLASLFGMLDALRGRRHTMWTSSRRDTDTGFDRHGAAQGAVDEAPIAGSDSRAMR